MNKDENPELTHEDARGRVRMVDDGDKEISRRTATARGWIRMKPETLAAVRRNEIAKGHVLAAAQIAGIAAGKRAHEWIPLCHPLTVDLVDVSLTLDDELPGVRVESQSRVTARTGAEMEAMVAVSAALLTVYDMCKGIDRGMELGEIQLIEKESMYGY